MCAPPGDPAANLQILALKLSRPFQQAAAPRVNQLSLCHVSEGSDIPVGLFITIDLKEISMSKLLAALVAGLFSAAVFAQATPATPATPAAPAAPAKAEVKAAPAKAEVKKEEAKKEDKAAAKTEKKDEKAAAKADKKATAKADKKASTKKEEVKKEEKKS